MWIMGITMTKTIDINIHCFRTFKEDLLHLMFKIFQIYYYIIFILFNLFGVQSDLTAEGLAASSQRQGTCSAPHRRDVAFEMFVYLQVTYQGVPYYWAHFVFSYFVCFCLSFWIRGVLGLSPRRKIEKSYHTLTATKT